MTRIEPAARWTLQRVFAFGSACAVLVTAGAVALGTAAFIRLNDTRSVLLDQVGPAVLAAQSLLSDLVDQETGVRGFVIGDGDPAFLDPYTQGLAAQQRDEAALQTLIATGDQSRIVVDLAAVRSAVARWRSAYAQPAINRATAVSTDAGRTLFDQVRAAAARLQGDLNESRLAARSRLQTATTNLAWVGVGVILLVVLFLAATAFGLRRSVLRPVSSMAAQVRAVASGDVGRPVRGDGPREIIELGDDVDSMRLSILRDLESAKETNRRLDEQTRELGRSNSDLEQFAYVASHDLQEPLRKVASFCQLLQRRYSGRLDERADQYIAFAVDGAQRMQQLINDLLAFSRVGRTTAAFVDVSLDNVVEAAAAQLQPARDDVHGTIDAASLPTVRGDATLLRALFLNLLGNALKFHREGVPPKVVVSADPVGSDGDPPMWEIAVADNGIGIDAEYAEKVFVIFQRLHARDVYAGTGIGLALAKKIVEFHGGCIGIDPPRTEPGTTIRLTLPATPRESA